MDVKRAFLYGEIKENVYLKPPDGVKLPEVIESFEIDEIVAWDKKFSYLLVWKFSSTIIEYGFKRSDNDYCFYSLGNMYLSLYVDDIFIVRNNMEEIERV